MSMRYATITLLIGLSLTAAVPAIAAPGDVRVARTGSVTVGSRQIFASSQLAVTWVAGSGDQTHHFEIVARDSVQGTTVRASAVASASSVTLTGLKASTTYAVTVLACANETCSQSSSSASTNGETDTEYWQLQGTGNTVDRLTKIVSDGNARLSATRLGPDAGAMANRIQLYYGPMNTATSRQAQLSVAVASGTAAAAAPDTFLSFTSRAGSSGLIAPTTSTTLIAGMATGQGVPVARDKGGFVRLFFEAQGADGRTRAMWIDSKDGYFGLDFNAGAASTCSSAADYSAGGGCEPTVAIAVDGDVNGNSRITHSRQFKVAWPTLDSPHHGGGLLYGVHVRSRYRLLGLPAESWLRGVGWHQVGGAVPRQRLPETVHQRAGGLSVPQRRRALPPVLRRSLDHHRPGDLGEPAVPGTEEVDLRRWLGVGRSGRRGF